MIGTHNTPTPMFVQRSALRSKFRFILSSLLLLTALTVLLVVPGRASAVDLCGEGSAPDYGFTDDLRQPHWTVGWEGYVSEDTVDQVDAILDQLDADSIAQTMILFKPQEEVGNRVNCAVHFLRYMQLGLPTGERKDNGFVFLVVVEPNGIDVHYGVGLGLPALTAHELTNLNRAAEASYQSTYSMDEALLTLVQDFDQTARANYAPLRSPTPQPAFTIQPIQVAGPLGFLVLCGQCCLGLLVLFLVIKFFTSLTRLGGGSFHRSSGGFPRSSGFPRFGGGGRSAPRSRGGSGSGRSGRGN